MKKIKWKKAKSWKAVIVTAVLLFALGIDLRAEAQVASLNQETSAAALKHKLGFDLGLLSALGFGGASYTYAPTKWLRLEAGAGFGLSGFQLSLMPKIAIGSGNSRFVAGIGVAEAIAALHSSATTHKSTWLNADLLGYEYRSNSGHSFHFAVGFTAGLAGETYVPCDCDEGGGIGDCCYEKAKGMGSPQMRFGYGKWF